MVTIFTITLVNGSPSNIVYALSFVPNDSYRNEHLYERDRVNMECSNYKFCTACGECFDPSEVSTIALYDVCDKCKEELTDTIYKMINKYAESHSIRTEGNKTKYDIAEDLLMETVAIEF